MSDLVYIALMSEYIFTREPNGTSREVGSPQAIEMSVKDCRAMLQRLEEQEIPKNRNWAVKEYPSGHIRAVKRTCSSWFTKR